MTSLLPSSPRSVCMYTVVQILFILVCLPVSSLGFCRSGSITQQCTYRGNHAIPKYRYYALHLSVRASNEVSTPRGKFDTPLPLQILERGRCKLFHNNKATSSTTSRLQMTNVDSSNEISNNSKNPFVRVWLWFRQLFSKIWVRSTWYFFT